jgi:hypothetical protein
MDATFTVAGSEAYRRKPVHDLDYQLQWVHGWRTVVLVPPVTHQRHCYTLAISDSRFKTIAVSRGVRVVFPPAYAVSITRER